MGVLMVRLNMLALGAGVVFAVAAGVATFLILRAVRDQPLPVVEVVPVVHAATDIAPGTVVTRASVGSLLTIVREPAGEVPGDAITSVSLVTGQTILVPVRAGERISTRHFEASSVLGGMQNLLPPGFVAVVMPATEQISVGGAVQPQDRVDLIASIPARRPDGSQQLVTQTLLRDVRVVATGQQTLPPLEPSPNTRPQAYSTLTLALPPQDALVVEHLLSTNVRVVLALRRAADEPAATQPVTTDDILQRFGLQAPAPPPP
jgi:pilus assembly protein CpaB